MINLLPSQYKLELKQEENRKLVLILEFLFLIFLISLASILFSIETYIKGQTESLKILADLEEKTFQMAENQLLREKISLANQNLSQLKSFYQTKTDSVEILEKISRTLPAEIYLASLSWQENTSQLILSGYALTREVLLKFKKNLEKTKEFSEIYFPPSNWLKPMNIDFQATFKIVK